MRLRAAIRPCLAAAGACLTIAHPAAAEPAGQPTAGLQLRWDAPRSCPDREAVRARVERGLGVEGLVGPTETLVANGRIFAADGHFTLQLEINTAAGSETTEAEAPGCEVLVDLVALKIGLALDPLAVAEAAFRPEPSTPPVVEQPSSARRGPVVVLEIGGSAGIGVLPTFEGGPFVGVAGEGRRWRTGVVARFAEAPPVANADLEPGGVRLLLVGGTAVGCMIPETGNLAVPLCLAVDAAGVRARGFDLAVERTSWRPYLGVGLETGVSWPRDGMVRLAARLRTIAAVLRPSFEVEGAGEVHRSAPLAGHLLVGVELVPGARHVRSANQRR